jgi:hypothetical protein
MFYTIVSEVVPKRCVNGRSNSFECVGSKIPEITSELAMEVLGGVSVPFILFQSPFSVLADVVLGKVSNINWSFSLECIQY